MKGLRRFYLPAAALSLLVASGCAETEEPAVQSGAPCETSFDCESGELCQDRRCTADGDAGLDADSNTANNVVNNTTNNTTNNVVNNTTNNGDPDVGPDTPELGLLGEPCDIDADCRSGYCIVDPIGGTRICSDFCAEGSCDEGYDCAPIADGADRVFLCFPAVDILCTVCETDADCGGLSDLCLEYGFANFCGQNCEANACPEGYECLEMEGPDGPTSQCRNIMGTCVVCDENEYDIDQLPENGCEYYCEYQSPEDVPDVDAIDTNCDGIDGNIYESVFVSVTGDDANPGTINAPMKTLAAALDKAESNGALRHVLVSEGTYQEQVRLEDEVSVWGGYSEVNAWERSPSYSTVFEHDNEADGRIVGVYGEDIVDGATLGFVIVRTGAPVSSSVSNYGVHCLNCPALRLLGVNVEAGPGGSGAGGQPGATGTSGGPGGQGGNGSCDGGPGGGGSAGFSPCEHPGGGGGGGGRDDRNGAGGSTGVVGISGGAGGREDGCDGGRDGINGNTGSAGGPGGAGAAGLRGGLVDGAYWYATPGAPGDPGAPGNGGGGGGGGAGQGGFWCDDGGGNGGGGGGGGACGGTGGGGGEGGGGSFGVFVVNSPGFAVTNSTIASAAGGRGGDGSTGGPGGIGGPGGSGASSCTDEVGAGGRGGDGGPGGQGGQGGGGAGGDSYAIILVDTPLPDLSSNTLTFGGGGGGGAGGNTGEQGGEGAYREITTQ